MSVVLTILVTLLVFGFLIAAHEFGHYLVARAFGVGVIEFSIGMGPSIHTWEGKNNDFSIRAFPIGGYVRLVGEPGEENPDDLAKSIGKKSLNDVKVWKRMLMVIAGPLTNILIAYILMLILVATSSQLASTKVARLMDDNVSGAYGIQAEDVILEVNGKTIHCLPDLTYSIMTDGIEPIDILVERSGEKVLLQDVVFSTDEENGIKYGKMDFYVLPKEKTLWNILYEGFWQGCNSIYMTLDSLKDMFSGRYGLDAIGGPVAIGEQIGETMEISPTFADKVRNLATMMALISVSLGICNLIPLPALDGGRFVIYLIEMIRRKPLPKKFETAMTVGCLILLLILSALIFLKDIINLF